MTYDPVKRREYYLRTRELKGRKPGSHKEQPASRSGDPMAKVARLSKKIDTLEKALSQARKILSEKRRSEQQSRQAKRKSDKKNSDGKTTAKERKESKEYRNRNRGKLAAEDSSTNKKTPETMTVDELETRVSRIKETIQLAKKEIREASNRVGSISHSLTQPAPPGLGYHEPTTKGESQNGSKT